LGWSVSGGDSPPGCVDCRASRVLPVRAVFTLRCTARLLRRLNAPVAAAPPTSDGMLGDWYANLLHVGRLQLVLAISEKTFLPVVAPAAPGTGLVARLREATATQLRLLGIPDDAVEAEIRAMQHAVYARTANRQVLGILVDFARAVPYYLDQDPSLRSVARRLAETPCSPFYGTYESSPDLRTPLLFGVSSRGVVAREAPAAVSRLRVLH
jgi:hypothetical protein